MERAIFCFEVLGSERPIFRQVAAFQKGGSELWLDNKLIAKLIDD